MSTTWLAQYYSRLQQLVCLWFNRLSEYMDNWLGSYKQETMAKEKAKNQQDRMRFIELLSSRELASANLACLGVASN